MTVSELPRGVGGVDGPREGPVDVITALSCGDRASAGVMDGIGVEAGACGVE